MKIDEVFCNTLKALRHELGHDRPRDTRPMWQRRLSTESAFCRAVVACGYLSEEQMQRAAERYRLGMSRDGGVIFWQIDEHEVLRERVMQLSGIVIPFKYNQLLHQALEQKVIEKSQRDGLTVYQPAPF